ASFPNAKRALHRRQYAAARKRIGAPRARLPGTRTAEEDALTMLDEGGELWLVTDDDMRARAEAGEGDALGAARRLVFGHALLEHVHAGCRDARARRLFLVVGDGVPVDIDEARVRADAALEAFLVRGGC
ncbi:MAG: DUF3025 domain-containing protein, partial [Polyangiaceae bacterium]|nr:DUF3025 domain-containing protein [Polyangiaceae bacterium]